MTILVPPPILRDSSPIVTATRPRQSPILGATGFDGGMRRAIAFAFPRRRPKIPVLEERLPCGTAKFGTSFILDLSGGETCVCNRDDPPTEIPREFRDGSPPSSYLFVADSPSTWVAAPNGSSDVYFGPNCDELEFAGSGEFAGFAECHTDGLQIQVSWFGFTNYLLYGATFNALGETQVSANSCGALYYAFGVIGTISAP